MLNRLSRVGFRQLNVVKSFSINSSSSSRDVLYINNRRSFCTEKKSEDESDIAKLFKITQEITQELGHTEEISPLDEDELGENVHEIDLKMRMDLPIGLVRSNEEPFDAVESKYPFPQLPVDMPLLPIDEPLTSIEDLVINYIDPFETVKPTTYAPFFRFAEPRGYTVETFLQKIGRECESHVELFPTWEDLMSTTSRKLKDLQVPVKNRKWILHWVEQFKQGRDPVFVSKAKSIAKVNKKK
ncbi:hypothetical protein DICPUDRAFT_158685 [Dictyostelium purpureum]|uniref:Small ribosomal subunit protein mS41 n=1 Tax=Dictyostelium purpureum TaxID=5786 RepID=F1A277_DICPU|nr:uncharacterized protein DICPUDRAFT_158685 [Dictyostelium purpureum]EGC29707.1 hypothetical protein DICPUDRAFT_158685 [Dictyostelium purpureum]|eukprot:XP_003293772.1 hypothetical protein DICPUDRAFT_158685 [Dictyostelium purpureum]